MVKDNLALFFRVIDELIEPVCEHYGVSPLVALTKILGAIQEEHINDKTMLALLDAPKKSLEAVSFSRLDIHKATGLLMLKALKESELPEGLMTPEVVGVLMAYLLDQLILDDHVTLFDPLVGTGNLLMSVVNYSEKDSFKLYGIDDQEILLNLCKANVNNQESDIELFYQNTLSLHLKNVDFIVSDIPDYDLEGQDITYFPYLVLLHHQASLREDGYFIALVKDDFFTHEQSECARKEIAKTLTVQGVIALPDDLFKFSQRMLVIFQKNTDPIHDFLLAKLPRLDDVYAMKRLLEEIKQWLIKRRVKHENHGS